VYDQYVAELKKQNRPTENIRFASAFWCLIVSNDPEKTFAEAADHIIDQANNYSAWLSAAGLSPLSEHLRDRKQLRQSGLLQVVDPDKAVSMIRDFANNVPLTHFYSDAAAWITAAMGSNPSRALCFRGDARVSLKSGDAVKISAVVHPKLMNASGGVADFDDKRWKGRVRTMNSVKIAEDFWKRVWKARNPAAIDDFVIEDFVLPPAVSMLFPGQSSRNGPLPLWRRSTIFNLR
jgi:hypothetical protein